MAPDTRNGISNLDGCVGQRCVRLGHRLAPCGMNPAAGQLRLTRYYHVWFSTKHRQEALAGEIGDFALEVIREIATRVGITILETAVEIDHVHLLLALREGQTLP